jgi:hypothetical protein
LERPNGEGGAEESRASRFQERETLRNRRRFYAFTKLFFKELRFFQRYPNCDLLP